MRMLLHCFWCWGWFRDACTALFCAAYMCLVYNCWERKARAVTRNNIQSRMTLASQIGEIANAYWTWDGRERSGSDLGILPERASPCPGSVDKDRLEPVQLLNQRMLQPRPGGAVPAVTAKPAVHLYFKVIRKKHRSLSDNSKTPV